MPIFCFTLGCGCGFGFSTLLLPLLTLYGGFMFVVFYLPYRASINKLAQGALRDKPANLFFEAYGKAVLWGVGAGALGLVFCVTMLIAGFMAILPLVVVGLIYAIHTFFSYITAPKPRHPAYKNSVPYVRLLDPHRTFAPSPNPSQPKQIGKLQYETNTLLLAMVLYAAGVFLVSVILQTQAFSILAPWMAYLGGSIVIAVLISADIERRERTEASRKSARSMAFLNLVLFPFTLPLAVLAWYRWRRALKHAGA